MNMYKKRIYNFDQIVDRAHSDSIKWDYIEGERHLTPRVIGDNPLAADELLPLWVADMDFPAAQPIIEALTARARHGVFGYTQPSGGYFTAIVNWMQCRHDWQIQPEWIVTMPGVMPSISLILQSFTAAGDGVIAQTPVFRPIYRSVIQNERQLIRNPLRYEQGRYTIDFDDLAQKAALSHAKMLILCSPHNPVGRVWNEAELSRLGQICLDNDLLLVSDEIHGDLIYSWATFTPIGKINAQLNDRLFICNAPSKTFNLPGLQTANVIISNDGLRQRLLDSMQRLNLLFGVNPFGATALQTAYESGENWLRQAQAYIEGNYLFLREFLAANAPQIQPVHSEGLYLAWLDCRQFGLSGQGLHHLFFEQAKVYLENGMVYGEEGEGFMRINLACPRQILENALARIQHAVAEMDGNH